MSFLPVTVKEVEDLGWDYVDFVFISGDAYVDHPSFGTAIITRLLERHGYRVCIIAQPNMKNNEDFTRFGEPRLGFLISSGNIDSMVNHYSVNRTLRSKDLYSPGGKFGLRPDRATIKYSVKIRELFPESQIILGGVEASLRRLSHFDYWDNKVRKSILIDSKADLLLYGMGERSIIEVADYLNSGLSIKDLIFIDGSVWKTKDESRIPADSIELPTYDSVINSKEIYCNSFMIQHSNLDAFSAKVLYERYRNHIVVCNPPQLPLSMNEMDDTYNLPFERDYHPMYESMGGVPSITEVKYSIIINRGCFGSCSFCSISSHQGRIIQSRSKASIIEEGIKITNDKDFKGYIHDVGGPTANFYRPSCSKQMDKGVCVNKQCLHPSPCSQLEVDHSEYLDILRSLRSLDKVKKVFIRSGIRYDYLMYDKDPTFFNELVKYHISGQLKVAPEHVSDNVLSRMGKPSRSLYDKFVKRYYDVNKKYDKNQFLVPYLMSSHPGSTIEDAIELALYVRELGYTPEQVQDFYPTPGTLSTCMYYAEVDPRTMEPIYVAKSRHDKAMQRALIQYKRPNNKKLVYEALIKANRYDLIGNKPDCLVKDIYTNHRYKK